MMIDIPGHSSEDLETSGETDNPRVYSASALNTSLDIQDDADPGYLDDADPEYLDDADPGCLENIQQLQSEGLEEHYNDFLLGDNTNQYQNPDISQFDAQIEDIKHTLGFIEALQQASLDSKLEPIDKEILQRIRNPKNSVLRIDNCDHRLSLDLFLSSASERDYNSARAGILRRYPDCDFLSYYKVKQLITDLSGVSAINRDMCYNSCMAYTGPFANLDCCPYCGEARYEPQPENISVNKKKVNIPRKQFLTLPIATQLQAIWRTPTGATNINYRQQYTEKVLEELQQNSGHKKSPYRDFFDGHDYLEAVQNGQITADDMVLMLSIDGAQLYRNKASECWIYIWVILDHAPEVRYKKQHILPGGFIPGPNKPKNTDSFIFPGLYHVASLQNEGLQIWDANIDRLFISHPFFALATADGPGMACLNGLVGHHGRVHCRLYCPLVGRHKQGGTHYYPARLKPINYSVQGCDHGDISLYRLLETFNSKESTQRYENNLKFLVNSTTKREYENRRLETGVCKPSILMGLPRKHRLSLPGCFAIDVMHLPALNIPDLLLPLWRGTFDCDKTDNKSSWTWAVLQKDVWKAHGKEVAQATPYIPGSFDRPPRNPAEKVNSGYKAWEFLLYFFGLGPCLFFGILPEIYWRNYCKAVRGIQILLQEEISPEELTKAYKLLIEFSDEFEEIYVQRRADRLHFVRPSIHGPAHIASETFRIGPGVIYSQWAIERTIGNLGEEIKQHSNPFANISQRGLLRCQINALKAMIPDIEPKPEPPRGAYDLGGGYMLLTARERSANYLPLDEANALKVYLLAQNIRFDNNWKPRVIKWARVRLPNGQIARSKWKESNKGLKKIRTSRNVLVSIILD
jgi:hypothetical protein